MNAKVFYYKLKQVIREKRLLFTLYKIIRDKTIRNFFKYSRSNNFLNINSYYSIIINNKILKLIYTNENTLSRNKTILSKEKQTINLILYQRNQQDRLIGIYITTFLNVE